jgi:hypothetical protein
MNRAMTQEAVVAQAHRNAEAIQHNVQSKSMRDNSGM